MSCWASNVQNLIKIVEPFLRKSKFYIFSHVNSLNFRGRVKTKNTARDIYKRTLDIEFERDRSVGLGVTLDDDGQKIKNYFSSFKDFPGKADSVIL